MVVSRVLGRHNPDSLGDCLDHRGVHPSLQRSAFVDLLPVRFMVHLRSLGMSRSDEHSRVKPLADCCTGRSVAVYQLRPMVQERTEGNIDRHKLHDLRLGRSNLWHWPVRLRHCYSAGRGQWWKLELCGQSEFWLSSEPYLQHTGQRRSTRIQCTSNHQAHRHERNGPLLY